jgi:predicted metal-dependent hydrolase
MIAPKQAGVKETTGNMKTGGDKRGTSAVPMYEDRVVEDDVTVSYRYCYSRRRKTLGVTVRPDLTVAVRAPLGTSIDAIRDFVRRHSAWIAKVRLKFASHTPKEPKQYQHGAMIPFQGYEYCLVIEAGEGEQVAIKGESLVVTTPAAPSSEQVRGVVDAWYRERAVEIFRERAHECHRQMQAEGFLLPRIAIRAMSSRWGSYSYRTRRITLNLNLVRAPQTCLDYVIIHELCHIKVRHHGPGFWKLVGRYVPDYAHQRTLLKAYIG